MGSIPQAPIEFHPAIAQQKPMSRRNDPCPFCAREALTDILETKGDMIWLLNKYPVMARTWQTLVIETARHDADITTYTADEWREILSFSMAKWRETIARGTYRSVIFYRNFGPNSGGSIRHPHSQIIGCEAFDYLQNIRPAQLDGERIFETETVRVTLANDPVCGLREFNLCLKERDAVGALADEIRRLVRFICDPDGWGYSSYNLFFYHAEHDWCKIVPRGVTSPLFLGYEMTQVPDEAARRKIVADVARYCAKSEGTR